MSNITVYLAHPSPNSLNGATARAITEELTAAGHTVELRDLYRLGFEPLLTEADTSAYATGTVPPDVATEQRIIAAADGIVLVYPTWWWSYPAMLKGFIDRVFTMGFAWEAGPEGVVGKLGNKPFFVAVTHGASRELYQTLGVDLTHFHDPLKVGTLGFCGVREIEVFASYGIPMYASDAEMPHRDEAARAAVAFFNPTETNA